METHDVNHDVKQKARSGPLAGLRVVEFAGLGPGPFACMLLSDMGADVVTVERAGNRQGQSFKGSFYVRLKGRAEGRRQSTTEVKDLVRKKLVDFKQYNLKVADPDASGQSQRQFNLNIVGNDLKVVQDYAAKVNERLKNHPALKEVDTSYREGKPEIQVKIIALTDAPLATLTDARELPAGVIGEIIVCGPVVTRIYDGQPEATAAAKLIESPTPPPDLRTSNSDLF